MTPTTPKFQDGTTLQTNVKNWMASGVALPEFHETLGETDMTFAVTTEAVKTADQAALKAGAALRASVVFQVALLRDMQHTYAGRQEIRACGVRQAMRRNTYLVGLHAFSNGGTPL